MNFNGPMVPENNFFFKLMSIFEDAYSQLLQNLIADDAFMMDLAQVRDHILSLKGDFEKKLTQALSKLNLPSKDMVLSMVAKAEKLESQALEIEKKLNKLQL